MRKLILGTAGLLVLLASACSNSNVTDDLNVIPVTFPNGTKITVEVKREQADLLRGMMDRESMAADHGMLFVHPVEDIFHYWMYQTKIPLDIIWLSRDHKIVEMSLDTPPCTTEARDCPNYGGTQKSQYALEVNAGIAKKNGLKVGDFLDF